MFQPTIVRTSERFTAINLAIIFRYTVIHGITSIISAYTQTKLAYPSASTEHKQLAISNNQEENTQESSGSSQERNRNNNGEEQNQGGSALMAAEWQQNTGGLSFKQIFMLKKLANQNPKIFSQMLTDVPGSHQQAQPRPSPFGQIFY